jgi:hypothetical protein
MVSAWPEPPFARHAAIIAGVRDGMEALACATSTETRPNRAEEKHRGIQAANLPGKSMSALPSIADILCPKRDVR